MPRSPTAANGRLRRLLRDGRGGERALEYGLFQSARRETIPDRSHGQVALLAQLPKERIFRDPTQRQQQRVGFYGVFELRRKDVAEADLAPAGGMQAEVVLDPDFRTGEPRQVLVARVLVQSLPRQHRSGGERYLIPLSGQTW